jgi:predicted PurR-regulated permease PerM
MQPNPNIDPRTRTLSINRAGAHHPMIYGRPVIFWLVIAVFFGALLWLLSEVLLPFVAGIALAYVQVPLADRLQRLGMNRTVAALLIVSVITLALLAIALLVAPYVLQQLLSLISTIPRHVTRVREIVADPDRPWLNWLVSGEQNKTVSEFVGHAASWLTAFAASLWSGGKALVSFVSVLIIMPVVTFYLICDWHGMLEILDSWVPPRHRGTVRELAREIDRVITGFLRGQFLICFLLGLYYAIALTLVGLQFGLLLGLIAGLITFVPYIGSLTGLLVGSAIAVAQFWPDWHWIVAVVAIFLVGQFVEGNIIAPKLVGDRVGLHPVWIIFAMFAFGYLLGFVGLLLAVPLAAAIAVLFRFGLRRYLASPIYTGGQPT